MAGSTFSGSGWWWPNISLLKILFPVFWLLNSDLSDFFSTHWQIKTVKVTLPLINRFAHRRSDLAKNFYPPATVGGSGCGRCHHRANPYSVKTYKDLYPTITSFTNLDIAWHKARKGKRSKAAVAA